MNIFHKKDAEIFRFLLLNYILLQNDTLKCQFNILHVIYNFFPVKDVIKYEGNEKI